MWNLPGVDVRTDLLNPDTYRFEWDLVEHWFEEDEENVVHPRYDFPTRQLQPVTGLVGFYDEKLDLSSTGKRVAGDDYRETWVTSPVGGCDNGQPMPGSLHLTKHHGLGNDFLVLLDQGGDADLAVALCDRRFGLGADGLLLGLSGDDEHDVVMRLHNADGSVAEMSGNGIRCLAQAVVAAGWVGYGKVYIATDAGLRVVDIHATGNLAVDVASVSMGPATVTELDPPWASDLGERAAVVDVGNPHLVLQVDPASVDLESLYQQVVGRFPEGVNLEVAAVTAEDAVTMRVRERGVGETLACGTGSCAVAAAFRSFECTGDRLWVTQPGGTARVALQGDEATLIGSTTYIGTTEVPRPDDGDHNDDPPGRAAPPVAATAGGDA